MLSNSSIVTSNPKPNSIFWNSGDLSKEFGVHRKETLLGNSEEFIGFLEVYIHQARDIHNICIYQNQDVYAKFSLTNDPKTTVSTQIIDGGGKNPIFNQTLRLNVRSIDSSIRCEIWMLSRIRNYLEDQLLGITLVPLSDVLCGNRKLENEFSLWSNDLFDSPAGFVHLTLSYTGSSPEVLEIPSLSSFLTASSAGKDSEIPCSVTNEFDKIEFPDLNIVNENEIMVSEYFRIPCNDLESESSESWSTLETSNHLSSEDIGVLEVESDTPGASKSPNQDSPKEKTRDFPNTSVNIVKEQKLVQQEIVDMYMKSMQQFTDSLAKMKLPTDNEKGLATSANTGCDEKARKSKDNGPSSRVFYGSRAFF